jgi:hypothetical protein
LHRTASLAHLEKEDGYRAAIVGTADDQAPDHSADQILLAIAEQRCSGSANYLLIDELL